MILLEDKLFRCLIGLMTLAVCFASCKKDEIVVDPPPKDPRTYSWTIDTVNYPGSYQTRMRDIWGSAPNNLYIVGHNERGFGKMFHYDGNSWQPVRLTQGEGGQIRGAIDLSSIYGFAPNDIYAVGCRIQINPSPPPNFIDSTLTIHFDGVQWTEVSVPSREGQMIGVRGMLPYAVWSGGLFGISYRLTNGIWQSVQSEATFFFSDFARDEYGTYALAYYPRPGLGENNFFLRWSDSTWLIADSMSQVVGYMPRFGSNTIRNIDGTLYSAGTGVFRKEGSSWIRMMNSLPNVMIGLYGTRREHIFAVGTSLSIWHFNGTDWYEFSQFASVGTGCRSVWCTEDEVFVVAEDGSKTYVYHGR